MAATASNATDEVFRDRAGKRETGEMRKYARELTLGGLFFPLCSATWR
jgi:hypothetical protein